MVLIFVLSAIFKVGIEYALLLGAILMGLLIHPLESALAQMILILFDETTLAPIMTAIAVMILVNLYDNTGMILEVQELLRSVFKRSSLIFSIVPAVLGLLPVAGGALLSAPFINNEGEEIKMDKSRRVYLNIWFRHSLVIVYPFTNLFILTITLTNVPPIELIVILVPVSAIMFLIGYLIGLRKLRMEVKAKGNSAKNPSSLMPLLLALSVGIVSLKLIGIWGIFFGALAGILAILLLKLPSKEKVFQSIIDGKVLTVALLLYSAMLFRSYVASYKIPELVKFAAFMPHPLLEILTSVFFGSS